MRKIFTFLTGIFVCALLTIAASAQSPDGTSRTQTDAATSARAISSAEIATQIARAKELLKSHLKVNADTIGVAALDPKTAEINIFSVGKDSFLTKAADITANTELDHVVRLHVIRPNGVNTSLQITEVASGAQYVPLVVQYPIVRSGAVVETAYYTSAHPALLSPDIVTAGNTYVTNMIENAASHLTESGVNISRDIIDIAEHLVIVEHTDHQRFLNDDRAKIYPDILSLYALNQGDTFRYSVSSAGAGGMIQMIPRTYEAIRQQHQAVSLTADFATGMRDHANALEAMLLYINDTWNYLQKQEEVQDALRAGLATKAELLAAGYNSNPMRLPAYLKNGGGGWRALIPAETQLYLSIYNSVDNNIKFHSTPDVANATVITDVAENTSDNPLSILFSWLSEALETKGRTVLNDLAR